MAQLQPSAWRQQRQALARVNFSWELLAESVAQDDFGLPAYNF